MQWRLTALPRTMSFSLLKTRTGYGRAGARDSLHGRARGFWGRQDRSSLCEPPPERPTA